MVVVAAGTAWRGGGSHCLNTPEHTKPWDESVCELTLWSAWLQYRRGRGWSALVRVMDLHMICITKKRETIWDQKRELRDLTCSMGISLVLSEQWLVFDRSPLHCPRIPPLPSPVVDSVSISNKQSSWYGPATQYPWSIPVSPRPRVCERGLKFGRWTSGRRLARGTTVGVVHVWV